MTRFTRLTIALIAMIVLILVACSTPPTPPSPTSKPVAPTTAPTSAPAPTTAPATSAPTTAPATTAPTVAPSATARPATAAPTATTQVAATKPPVASGSTPSSSGQTKVDMDKILPPGKGQSLLLNNCTSCHSFVCAVKGQRAVAYWQTIKLGHKERASGLADADYDALFVYLAENFNDKKPEPELPEALKDLGCSAQ